MAAERKRYGRKMHKTIFVSLFLAFPPLGSSKVVLFQGLKRQHEAWQQAVEGLLKELEAKLLVEAPLDPVDPVEQRLEAPRLPEELRVRSSRLELARKTAGT